MDLAALQLEFQRQFRVHEGTKDIDWKAKEVVRVASAKEVPEGAGKDGWIGFGRDKAANLVWIIEHLYYAFLMIPDRSKLAKPTGSYRLLVIDEKQVKGMSLLLDCEYSK